MGGLTCGRQFPELAEDHRGHGVLRDRSDHRNREHVQGFSEDIQRQREPQERHLRNHDEDLRAVQHGARQGHIPDQDAQARDESQQGVKPVEVTGQINPSRPSDIPAEPTSRRGSAQPR